jgi:feruloyl esterase
MRKTDPFHGRRFFSAHRASVHACLTFFALAAFATTALAATDCAGMAKLALQDVKINSATVVPAVSPVPEYCRLSGTLEATIEFEVALPTSGWNGKLFFAGGGGFNGSIPNLNQGLARGYVAAGSDTGHRGVNSLDAKWALNNPQAQLNYGHRATHLVTDLAKQLLRAYYGQPEKRAYFVGCSNGGKMGLTELQRDPNDFDGVVVGDPVIDRTKLMLSYTLNARALAMAPIPPAKLPLIEKATLAACDAQDGLVDGLVDSPAQCKFNARALTCTAGDASSCLTEGQVQALEKLWAGPRNAAGERLYPGFVPGHEDDYEAFITGNGTLNASPSSTWAFQESFMRYFVFDPNFNPVIDFNLEKHLSALAPFAADQDAASTDLSAFKARGGKLLMYHGWADHSITPLRTVEYYGDVRARHGSATDDFVRLFMVPGMHHCTKGPGPNSFGGPNQGHAPRNERDYDIVLALDAWVDQGIAPEKLIATKFVGDDPKKGVARTRPLCRYPQVARYNGVGDVNDAANFACVKSQ